MKKEKFGSYVRSKRIKCGISLRGFADMLEISPVYLCNIEKDRHAAPNTAIVKKIADILKFDEYETCILYDLAAASKHKPAIPIDIADYVMNNSTIRYALRLSQKINATEDDWNDFISVLKKKHNV